MSYLHSHDIIHCDLKPNNILLNNYLYPAIIDFGLARSINDKFDDTPCGTICYMAPEMHEENIDYDKPIDVFSFGMTIYSIITSLLPFPNLKTNFQIAQFITKGNRPQLNPKIPKCYRDLIEKCWCQEPKERPKFDDIVDILRSDPSFITEDVDKEEFDKYVRYIEESKNKNTTTNNNNLRNLFETIELNTYFEYRNEPKHIDIDLKRFDFNDFEKQKEIGQGSFGKVYKIMKKNENKLYAAKISKIYLNQCNNDDILNLKREITIISKMNHPAILKFIGFSEKNFNGKPKPTIITEIVSNGSLDKIIELERRSLSNSNWNDTKKLINIYGIASAMFHLHSKDIVHRDLKPANILLDKHLFPKISDFGLSKNVYENNQLRSGLKKPTIQLLNISSVL